MTSTIIVYYSAAGTTEKLAHAVCAGASEVGSATIFRINGDEIIAGRFKNVAIWDALDKADAIIFGSPTYMGGPAAQFKAFADASSDRWSDKKWVDKVASGFTVGSNLNGDQSATLTYFNVFAAQHGMLWCGLDLHGGDDRLGRNRLGTQLGLTTDCLNDHVAELDLVTAHYLGRRVAQMAARLSVRPHLKD